MQGTQGRLPPSRGQSRDGRDTRCAQWTKQNTRPPDPHGGSHHRQPRAHSALHAALSAPSSEARPSQPRGPPADRGASSFKTHRGLGRCRRPAQDPWAPHRPASVFACKSTLPPARQSLRNPGWTASPSTQRFPCSLRAKAHKTACDLWPHDLLARHVGSLAVPSLPPQGPPQGTPSQGSQVATRWVPSPPDTGEAALPREAFPDGHSLSPLGPCLKAETTTCLAWLPPPGQKSPKSRVSGGLLSCPALGTQ